MSADVDSFFLRLMHGLSLLGVLLVCVGWMPAAPQSTKAPSKLAGYGPDIRKTEEGIAYVSAGIGFDSRANLPQYPLKLVFATKKASYLANIDAEITPDPGGRPVRIHSTGPWLLVDLPPGKYTVKGTTAKGQKVVRQFEIVKGRVSVVKLVWDLSDEEI